MKKDWVLITFISLFFFLLLLFLFCHLAGATNYYVKNTGNDSLDGLSDANAWATISKINSFTFSIDDIAYFNKGDIWRQMMIPSSAGTSGHQITYSSYGTGDRPRIAGTLPLNPAQLLLNNSFEAFIGTIDDGINDIWYKWNVTASNIVEAVSDTPADGNNVAVKLTTVGSNARIYKTIKLPPLTTITLSWEAKTLINQGYIYITYVDGSTYYLQDDLITWDTLTNINPISLVTTIGNPWANKSATFTTANTTNPYTLNIQSGGVAGNIAYIDNVNIDPNWSVYSGTTFQIAIGYDPLRCFIKPSSDWLVAIEGTDKDTLSDHKWVYDAGYIYFRDDTGDPSVSGIEIEISFSASDECGVYVNYDYITIGGLEVFGWGDDYPNGYGSGITVDTQTGVFITDCKVFGNYKNGVWFKGESGTISSSIIDYNGSIGVIIGNGDNYLISKNDISYNGWYGVGSIDTSGIYILADSNSNTIEYNEIHHNCNTNIGSGLTLYNSSMNTINYNNVHDNVKGGIYLFGDNNKFYYNIINSNNSYGVRIGEQNSGGIKIYGNTIYGNIGQSVYEPGIWVTYHFTDSEIKNNIIYGNYAQSTNDLQMRFAKTCTDPNGSTVDTNYDNLILNFNCIGPESTGFIHFAGENYDTLANYTAGEISDPNIHEDPNTIPEDYIPESWRDGNSISSDPLFVDTNTSFGIAYNSPCVDIGTDLGSTYQNAIEYSSTWPNLVTLGDQEDSFYWDIGAYRFPGASYFVKNTGNDSLDGLSDANAWATIAKVNSTTLVAGDRIYLNKGDTWSESLEIDQSGTSSAGIIINAYGTGNLPKIYGNPNDVYAIYTDQNYIIFNNLYVDSNAYGIYIDGNSYGVTVQDSTIYGCPNTGIRFEGSQGTVADCTISSNSSSGISLHGIDYSILRNLIYGNNYGINFSSGSDNAIIKYNKIYNNTLALNVYSSDNSDIAYNLIYDNTGDSIKIEGNNNKFYYNLVYSNGPGTVLELGSANDDTGNLIYNNTFWGNSGTDPNHAVIYIKQDLINSKIKNNIIYKQTDCQLYIEPVGAYNRTGLELDYNLIGPESVGFVYWDGNSYDTLAAYQSVSGQDNNSFSSDPLLHDPNNDNFILDANSLCIDTGYDLGDSYDEAIDIDASWVDAVTFSDQDRDGYWDIGAYRRPQGTFYISNSGNDANNGTSIGTPWKTTTKVSNFDFCLGDTIYLNYGDTWREPITINDVGTSDYPITVTYYGDANLDLPRIAGTIPLTPTYSPIKNGKFEIINGTIDDSISDTIYQWRYTGSRVEAVSDVDIDGNQIALKMTRSGSNPVIYQTIDVPLSSSVTLTWESKVTAHHGYIHFQYYSGGSIYYLQDDLSTWNTIVNTNPIQISTAIGSAWSNETSIITTPNNATFTIYIHPGNTEGDSVYIDNLSLSSAWSNYAGNIWKMPFSYYKERTDPLYAWLLHPKRMFVKPVSTWLLASNGYDTGHTKDTLSDHEWIYDTGYIYFRDDTGDPTSSGIEIETPFFYLNRAQAEKGINITKDARYVEIDGLNSFGWSAAAGIFTEAGASNLTIENCTVFGNYISGILSQANNVTIHNNIVSYTGGLGIRSYTGDNIIISNNEVSYNGWYGVYDVDGEGIGLGIDGNNVTVEYNEIYNNGVRNRSLSFKDVGFILWNTDNSTIRYNLIHDNYGAGSFVAGDNINFIYNLIYGNDGGLGLRIGSDASSDNIKVYNNTVAKNTVLSNTWPGGVSVYRNLTNSQIKNNIIWGNEYIGANPARYDTQFVYTTPETYDRYGNVIDYNLMGPESSNYIISEGVYYSTRSAYRTATGYEVHSFSGTPYFTDANNSDFTLDANAPCINAGMNFGAFFNDAIDPNSTWVNSVTTQDQDCWGFWEIGAYPYNEGNCYDDTVSNQFILSD